jgi:predicted GIY-YIG superfamily endonuclease
MARRGVYVLLLEGSRYYVGSSADVARRVAAHRAGTGAAFTRRFGVVDEHVLVGIDEGAARMCADGDRLTSFHLGRESIFH